MKVEDCFGDLLLPVNSLAILNRLMELLREHKTNSFLTKKAQKDIRVRKCMWLLLELYGLFPLDQEPHIKHLWRWSFDEYKRIKSLERAT